MLVVIPASMGNVWRVAGIMEDDDSRDRGEGEVGGVMEVMEEENMNTKVHNLWGEWEINNCLFFDY